MYPAVMTYHGVMFSHSNEFMMFFAMYKEGVF